MLRLETVKNPKAQNTNLRVSGQGFSAQSAGCQVPSAGLAWRNCLANRFHLVHCEEAFRVDWPEAGTLKPTAAYRKGLGGAGALQGLTHFLLWTAS